MLVFLLPILALVVLFPGRNTAAYDEFCRMECWSRRKPCCRAS